MKKQIFALILLAGGFVGINGARTEMRHTTATVKPLDAVDFWKTTIKVFKKEGYSEDSPEVRHAVASLHRIEARRARKPGFFSTLMGRKKAPVQRKKSTVKKEASTEKTHKNRRVKKAA